MNTKYFWILQSLLVGCFAFLLTLFMPLLQEVKEPQMTPSIPQTTHECHIGVLCYGINSFLQKILDTYQETLQQLSPRTQWRFTFFNANNNLQLLHSMAEECLIKKYDLILSIGSLSLQTIHAKRKKRSNNTTPIICSNIHIDVWNELKKENPTLHNNFTGCGGRYAWNEYILPLRTLLPSCKKVLIPFPEYYSEDSTNSAKILATKLAEHGIEGIPLYSRNKIELMQFLKAHVHDIDAIWLFRESEATCPAATVSMLSERYHIPSYACSKYTIQAGCSFGIDFNEALPGIISAQLTTQILIKNKNITDLPFIDLTEGHKKFIINSTALRQQGITLDPRILFLAEKGVIIDSLKKKEYST